MNEQQEKLYQAMLDMNGQAEGAGDPYIVDPERARTLLADLAAQADDKSAAELCARISNGQFYKDLAKEREVLAGARKDFADGSGEDDAPLGRMEYLFMEVYAICAGKKTQEARTPMWRTVRIVSSALTTGMVQISQQKVTNYFSRFIRGPRQRRYGEENPTEYAEEFTAIAENGKYYKMMIERADDHAKAMRVTTLKLLHFLLKNFSETHQQSVDISLRDYAELLRKNTGKNSLDELQMHVREDLYALGDIKVEWFEKRTRVSPSGKRRTVYEPTGYMRLNGGSLDVSRYMIHWNWNVDLLPSLQTLAPLDFPEEYFSLSDRDDSYPFAHYIALNYRRNEGKESCSKIKIETLLKEAKNLPDYEKVKKQRRVKERLIKPFFRDLNKVPRLVYDIFLADGTRVENTDTLTDEEFLTAYIEVDYSAYPVHKHRIEQKNRHEVTKNKIAEQAKLANAVKTGRRGKKGTEKK